MPLLDRLRRPIDAAQRRRFLRRLTGTAADALPVGSVPSSAELAGRPLPAARFVPGTVVDAHGWPLPQVPMDSQPYIGEVMLVALNFAPLGYELCQGQLLPIDQYNALFALIGTTYGGNGQTTFGLPDLRGRTPVGQGQGPGLSTVGLGERAGTASATLTLQQMPAHTHPTGTVAVSNALGTTADPTGAVLARPASGIPQYAATAPTGALAASAVSGTLGAAGTSQPFDNRSPYLGLNYCMATEGIFPSQN